MVDHFAKIKDVLIGILENTPEVLGVILLDGEGVPIETAGDFPKVTNDLGTVLTACFRGYVEAGKSLGQNLQTVTLNYDDLKFCLNRIPGGVLIVIATQDAQLGMIRLEARRAQQPLTQIMVETREQMEILKTALAFSWLQAKDIDNIVSRFRAHCAA